MPFLFPGDLPNPGIKPVFSALQADSLLLSHPLSFIQMLDEAVKCELPLLCYENEEGLSIKDAIAGRKKPASVAIIVGSEGGFSPEEAAEAMKRGVKSVSLGNRILRCETAPSFALAALSYEFEL